MKNPGNSFSSLGRLAAIFLLAFALAACGGGGGGQDSTPTAQDGNDGSNGNDGNDGNGGTPPDDGPVTFSIQRVYPALSFSQITELQTQPYPAAASASGDRIFVVQKNGIIRVFDNRDDVTTSSEFLNISARVTDAGSEQGLLGLAFHPQFESNGQFYVFYTVDTNSIPQQVRVSQFVVPDQSAAPNTADASSEQIVLIVDQAGEGPAATNHNGGALAFSPLDGLLYIAVGDGGSGNDPRGNGQNLATLSGSLLRIDVDNPVGGLNYGIPANNPFAAQSGARGEIFARGLRNPFKFSFDTMGDLWIGDVGQNALEEVDFLAATDPDYNAGPNFGWDCREGSQAGGGPDAACNGVPASAFTDPVDEYGLTGSQSITGGYVYRGTALAALTGRYLYADFVAGLIWAYDPASDSRELLVDSDLGVSSFGRDGSNELIIADFFSGGLFRLILD